MSLSRHLWTLPTRHPTGSLSNKGATGQTRVQSYRSVPLGGSVAPETKEPSPGPCPAAPPPRAVQNVTAAAARMVRSSFASEGDTERMAPRGGSATSAGLIRQRNDDSA